MKSVADAAIDSRVTLMASTAEAGEFELGAQFDVMLPSVADPELATRLVRTAHALCPYSKATGGNIDLRLTVNGMPAD